MRGELFVCDTEADDLYDGITYFHCYVFSNLAMTKWRAFCDYKSLPEEFVAKMDEKFSPEWYTLEEFSDWHHSGEMSGMAAHNILGFDLPAMEKLNVISGYDLSPDTVDGRECRIYDTLSMSRCLNPDRQLPKGCPTHVYNPVTKKKDKVGPHGLMAWGYRVDNMKPKVDDWRDQPLEVYVDRCFEDVVINIGTWKLLVKEAKAKATGSQGWAEALALSQEAFNGMCTQERTGVPFDIEKAEALLIRIDGMMEEIANDVEPKLPLRVLPKSQQLSFPANPFDKSGNIGCHGWNWLRKLGYKLNEEAFNKVKVPAKPFKGCGNPSKVGEKFMQENGLTTSDQLREAIRKGNEQNIIFPLDEHELDKAMCDLEVRHIPILKEPMKLSNQNDIKVWLYTKAGWEPNHWRTKDVTKDQFKKARDDKDILERVEQYVDDTLESVYRKSVYKEMGMNFETTPRNKLIDKLLRKARYLVTSPQYKDERGDLCENLATLNGDLAKQIVKWLSLRNRRSTLQALDEKKTTGWLNHPRIYVDGRLPAGNSGLTNTHRWKHRTVVNVPKADPKVLLGKEFRELFYAPEGWAVMGWDGSALEQRVACYYCWKYDDGWYFNETMGEEDYHEKMAAVYREYAPHVTRSSGKNISYGLLYGAQAAKMASMLGITLKAAQALVDGFWEANWSLKLLKDDLEAYWENTGKSYIRGVDGRKIYTRSKHSLLNALFQSTGAVFMDKAGEILRKSIREEGLDENYERLTYSHDDYHSIVRKSTLGWKSFETEDEAKAHKDEKIWSGVRKSAAGKYVKFYNRIGELASQAIEAAGDYYKSPLPITAEYMIGVNFSETH